ncbi:MAG: hypothetical protein WCH46_07420 [bacterium]
MRNKALVAIIVVVLTAIGGTGAKAQFSKAVVVLKGVVRSEQTGKAHSVKVSVRAAGDKAVEITSSKSNSASGSYLVVLQANKKYWVHLEGEDIVTKDELIETPAAAKTVQLEKDFNVTLTSAPKQENSATMR